MKKVISLILSVSIMLTALVFCVPAQAETHYGIDVSAWQGSINWSSVKNAGVKFAILRAYCNGEDSYFETNYANANAAGVPIGAYSYIFAKSVADARTEAQNLVNTLNGANGDVRKFQYPIFVDIEDPTYSGIGTTLTAQIVQAELEVLRNAGYYAAIYTYSSFAASYIDMSMLSAYDVWIADYRGYVGYTGSYTMWQYSCTGSVSGIEGDVDENYCYIDYPTKIAATGLNGYESYAAGYSIDSNNYMINDFENQAGISGQWKTNATVSTTQKKQGSKSLFIEPTQRTGQNSNVAAMAWVNYGTNTMNLSAYDYINYDFYLTEDYTGQGVLQVNFGINGNQDGFNSSYSLDGLSQGWHSVSLLKSSIGMPATSDWSKINFVRITWFNTSQTANTVSIYFDNLRASNTGLYAKGYKYDDKTFMINDFDNLFGIKAQWNSKTTLSSAVRTEGSASLSLDPEKPIGQSGDVGAMAWVDYDVNTMNLTSYNYITYDIYLKKAYEGTGYVQVNFGINGSQDGFNSKFQLEGLSGGWHRVVLTRSQISEKKDSDWTKIDFVRITWFNSAQQNQEQVLYFDNLVATNHEPYATGKAIDDNKYLIHACDDYSGFETKFITTLEMQKNYKEGTGSVKLIPHKYTGQIGDVGAMAFINYATPMNLTAYEYITFHLFLSKEFTTDSYFQINFATDGSQDGFNQSFILNTLSKGWNTLTLKREDIVKKGANADWSSINRIRLTFFNTGNDATGTFYVDGIYAYNEVPDTSDPDSSVIEPSDPSSSETSSSDADSSTESSEEISFKYGDVTMNGEIKADDAMLALQHAVEKVILTGIPFLAADIDNSGRVTSADALSILQYSVSIISVFPAEQ